MGRNRKLLHLEPDERAQMLRLCRSLNSQRDRERLKAALRAGEGRYTLEDLAALAGRSRSTIQNWLNKFTVGRIAGLLERDTPPGAASPLAHPEIQKQLEAGLSAGRWRSAAHIATWLQEAHGIRRARKSIYYWLQKKGWGAPHAKRR